MCFLPNINLEFESGWHIPVKLPLMAGILCITAYLFYVLLACPYLRKGDDRFHILALVITPPYHPYHPYHP